VGAIDSDRVLGAILAGAVGDALGAPLEFLPITDIRRAFGPDGLTGYAPGAGITEDTQLTLFTAEGLIRAHVAARRDGISGPVPFVQHAYQRWLHTQDVPWERAGGVFAKDSHPDGWLVGMRGLHRRRGAGSAVLAALTAFAETGDSPSPEDPANDAKGSGAVMRAAPVALWGASTHEVFTTAANLGTLTHGHPSGYLPAAVLAVIVRELVSGTELPEAVALARVQLRAWPHHHETDLALESAITLAARGRPSPETLIEELGHGWHGEQALAIAVCAALTAEDLADGLRLAVNHSGDSDTTGAICGNLLGARHGLSAIPEEWLRNLELREVIQALAEDLVTEFEPLSTVDWHDRYPAW
jgi:ADP-ribosylglycohydrolase